MKIKCRVACIPNGKASPNLCPFCRQVIAIPEPVRCMKTVRHPLSDVPMLRFQLETIFINLSIKLFLLRMKYSVESESVIFMRVLSVLPLFHLPQHMLQKFPFYP